MERERAEHLIDLAIELSQAAAYAAVDPGTTNYLEESFSSFIENVRGIQPSDTELEATVAEAVDVTGYLGGDTITCQLVDTTTGEVLQYSPTTLIYAPEEANKEMAKSNLAWVDVEALEGNYAPAYAKPMPEAKSENVRRFNLNTAEHAALFEFADANGRTWKSKLRAAWEAGSASHALHALRNVTFFGPKGLEAYKPEKLRFDARRDLFREDHPHTWDADTTNCVVTFVTAKYGFNALDQEFNRVAEIVANNRPWLKPASEIKSDQVELQVLTLCLERKRELQAA